MTIFWFFTGASLVSFCLGFLLGRRSYASPPVQTQAAPADKPESKDQEEEDINEELSKEPDVVLLEGPDMSNVLLFPGSKA